jgi:predicted RNA methylase
MPEPRGCIEALRAGRPVVDEEFDALYPPAVRQLSERHFTPIAVAQRAARLLVTYPGARILDVGAGAGKFCLVGALVTRGSFTGIERNHVLVGTARQLALAHRVRGVHFIHGDVKEMRFDGYQGYYLFNPFAAPRSGASIALVCARLAASPTGTRVVTYHGFGGILPATYRCAHREASGTDLLELWIKEPPQASTEVTARRKQRTPPGDD